MTDLELIDLYLNKDDQKAFEILLGRYLNLSKSIVRKLCNSTLDVEDLVQQSWIKIIQSLSTYNDQQKFGAFVATVTKNTVRDYWRYNNVRSETDFFSDVGDEQYEFDSADVGVEISEQIDSSKQFDNLMTEYIPGLPEELRIVFLLKHEAEYWDGKKRLDWNMIGKLTGQTESEAWQAFDSTRKIYKWTFDGNVSESDSLSSKETETFLLWTQSQRPMSAKKVTEDELSSLLGIPVNTFKTRYRAAKHRLSNQLQSESSDVS